MSRTDKCELITSEMSWQEVLEEYRKIENDFDVVMSLSGSERLTIGMAMFSEHRHQIIESLPKDLSEREFKKQLYYQTYDKHLPADFFKDEE